LANVFGILAMTVQKAMDWTGQAHLLDPFPERLSPPVKSDRDVVERCTQAGRNPISGLAKNVGAPNDIGIFCLKRRQQLMKAVANGFVGFSIWLNRQILDINLLQIDLQATAPDDAALVIDERCRQYAPQPSTDSPDISQLPGTFKRSEREAVQEFFGLVPTA
jgi:hypothetical protein